ncbi:MAG: serine/threonine protein kinase [Phormidesmis sp. RL_2_1]|nr:serine/threonine protein kinase [Phormidesmis sp. RL_2_1]
MNSSRLTLSDNFLLDSLPDSLTDSLTETTTITDESTSFQDASGNVKPIKRLFKNRFKIIRRLGRGGFSTAYLAQDITASNPVACVIKHLKYPFKADTSHHSQANHKLTHHRISKALGQERLNCRFQREARMMARLARHPQLPRLLDHFTDGDQFYLVQEHIPGPILSQEFSRKGPQSEADVKAFLQEMLPIIRHMHRHQLLHLDIKPSNIIRRSSDQKLVLIDFGAVRRYPNEGALSTSEKCAGTVGFAPAEQLAGNPTFASDIYALGVTALYMLTMTSPLDFATSPRGQHLRWQESVTVSRYFKQILSRMLHPDAERRFQTIDELARALSLEPHYDTLKTCMTSQPWVGERFERPEACRLEDYAAHSGLSQTRRQAASIRRWQQRRRQFATFTPK